jgi:hypothetical protein
MGCIVEKQAAKTEGIAPFLLAAVADVPRMICAVAGKRAWFSTLFLQLWRLLDSPYQRAAWRAYRFPVAPMLGTVRWIFSAHDWHSKFTVYYTSYK